jgi:hypothetical protein
MGHPKPDSKDIAIMISALALPSKWDAFRQSVIVAYAAYTKQQQVEMCMKCLDMARNIKRGDAFKELPAEEKLLFDTIQTNLDVHLFDINVDPRVDWPDRY